MFNQLDEVEKHYEELTSLMGAPEIAADPKRYNEIAKEHRSIETTVTTWRAYKECNGELESARELLEDDDPDMRDMARSEVDELSSRLETLDQSLRVLLLPKDPNDEKNVVLEIRAGTGGDEASLFAADLFRMYCRYAETMRWKVEPVSSSST
ncbi:MAG: PCRF domain-containing protein, partial [Myxococcota bacterium]|nr:PCRF domain-containing protein [Myxococcota bacterium]